MVNSPIFVGELIFLGINRRVWMAKLHFDGRVKSFFKVKLHTMSDGKITIFLMVDSPFLLVTAPFGLVNPNF